MKPLSIRFPLIVALLLIFLVPTLFADPTFKIQLGDTVYSPREITPDILTHHYPDVEVQGEGSFYHIAGRRAVEYFPEHSLAFFYPPSRALFLVGEESFGYNTSKEEIETIVPTPTYVGDTNRPFLYVNYDTIDRNLRLGYIHQTNALEQVRIEVE